MSDDFAFTRHAVLKSILASVLFVTSYQASAGFNLGDAANYAVLFEGGGQNNLDLSGPDTFYGNLGVGNPSGSSAGAQLSGQLTLYGSVSLNFAGNPGGNYKNSATFKGPGSFSEHNNVPQVQTDLNTLNSLSSTLGGESGTALAVNINNSQSATINAIGGSLDTSGNRVFTVSSWNFGGGSTLTINGDAAGDSVVINFPAQNINNPSFAGKIVLNGLNSDRVLFNFTGGSSLSGGPTLTVSANGATEYGTFLDPNGPMSIDNAVLVGHFFGGDSHNDQVVSGAEIVPENGTMLAGALLLLPLGTSMLRILRQKRMLTGGVGDQ